MEVIKVGKPKKVKKAVWREALGVRRPSGFQFALFHFLSVLASINHVLILFNGVNIFWSAITRLKIGRMIITDKTYDYYR